MQKFGAIHWISFAFDRLIYRFCNLRLVSSPLLTPFSLQLRCYPSASSLPPLFFPCTFGLCVCISEDHSTRSVEQKKKKKKQKKLTHSCTNFTHSTLGENAKTSGRQNNNNGTERKREAPSCLWETSELSCRDKKRHKNKPACSPQANFVYISVHANSI